MVKDIEQDGKRLWDIIYKLTAAQYTKFFKEPENKDQRVSNPRENASGQVYSIVNDLKEAGFPIEVPQGVLDIMEPKPITFAAQPVEEEKAKGLARTIIESPVTFGSGVLGGVKKIGNAIAHGFKLTPQEKPQEEG